MVPQLIGAIILQPANAGTIMKTVDFLLNDIGIDQAVVQPRHDYSCVTLETYLKQPNPQYSPEMRRKLLTVSRQVFVSPGLGEIAIGRSVY